MEKTRVFFGGSASRLPKLFHSFPYVAALCATQALSDAYGEADHGIYRHIEEVLARYITNAAAISSTRVPRLSRAIADACGQADLVRGPFVESLPDFEKGGLDSRAFGSRKGLRYVARCYPVTSAQKA